MSCPQKPFIINPIKLKTWKLFPTTFESLFGKDTLYSEMVEQLAETLEGWKDSLSKVSLYGVHLEGAFLMDAHLDTANLIRAHLESTYLRRAHLEFTHLENAHLDSANFYQAHLENAFLVEALLEGANLKYAHLEHAFLDRALLEGADFTGAYLNHAELRGAHLNGANLTGVFFEDNKDLTFNQLNEVKTLYKTTGITPELMKRIKEQCPEKLATRFHEKKKEWYVDSVYLKEILNKKD